MQAQHDLPHARGVATAMRPNRLHAQQPRRDSGLESAVPSAAAPAIVPRERSVRHAIRGVAFALSRRFRARRAERFRTQFKLDAGARILDLGGGDGEHIRMVLEGSAARLANVYVADVNEKALERARAYGHPTALLTQDGKVPFPDGFFDVVFCSSVIEHVTVPKSEVWQHRSELFAQKAIAHQRAFADEILRISKSFWVQTPARSFFLETHSWLPFVGWLPRAAQIAILSCTRHFWLSRHPPDYYLLTRGHMEALFPGARIVSERWFGMTKSWIAVRQH
jgi:SAM-dependent methyltransferase